jgi:hypothetical protein
MEPINKRQHLNYIRLRNIYLETKHNKYTMEHEKDVININNELFFGVGNKYICGYCDESTTKKRSVMRTHLQCHNFRPNKVFKCKICGYNSFANREKHHNQAHNYCVVNPEGVNESFWEMQLKKIVSSDFEIDYEGDVSPNESIETNRNGLGAEQFVMDVSKNLSILNLNQNLSIFSEMPLKSPSSLPIIKIVDDNNENFILTGSACSTPTTRRIVHQKFSVDLTGSNGAFADMVSKAINIHQEEIDNVRRKFSEEVKILLGEHLQMLEELERVQNDVGTTNEQLENIGDNNTKSEAEVKKLKSKHKKYLEWNSRLIEKSFN